MQSSRWQEGRHTHQRGQTATEYVLIVAVVVLGILAAVSLLLPKVKAGADALGEHLLKRFQNNPVTQCDPTQGQTCD